MSHKSDFYWIEENNKKTYLNTSEACHQFLEKEKMDVISGLFRSVTIENVQHNLSLFKSVTIENVRHNLSADKEINCKIRFYASDGYLRGTITIDSKDFNLFIVKK